MNTIAHQNHYSLAVLARARVVGSAWQQFHGVHASSILRSALAERACSVEVSHLHPCFTIQVSSNSSTRSSIMKACTCLTGMAAVSLLTSAEAFVPVPTGAAQARSVQQQQLQQLAAAAAAAAAAGPAGSATAAPASLRIVPNLPASDAPQRSRVPPGFHTLQLRDQSSYANAMHVDKLNLHIEPIVAMACEEFKDFFARCIERNAAGST
jgi:hypothetical protein